MPGSRNSRRRRPARRTEVAMPDSERAGAERGWARGASGAGAERGGGNRPAGWLDVRVAVITGAGTGIGAAVAHRFAAEGARVVLAGRRERPLRRAESVRGILVRTTTAGEGYAGFRRAPGAIAQVRLTFDVDGQKATYDFVL